MASNHPNSKTPLRRFFELIQLDARDLAVVLGYTMLTGILALAVPLAAQALVNTVAVGIFLQPLVVLSAAVLILLLFRGGLRLLKLYLIEILQQRVFTRVSLELAHHIPRIRQDALANSYAPELANRFFDVLTVQKSWAKLLIGGPAALLQIFTGLLLMAFYSPLLLAFDLVLIVGATLVLFVLGIGGVKTSIQESAEKYRVAHWLEEVGRCERNLKFTASPDFTVNAADDLVCNYLDARNQHFRVLLRQAAGSYLLQALASASILAIGGWLVIQRQLTMGQLVASELIVISVIAAIEKLVRLTEPFYDLLTALEKIGHVTDLPQEADGGAGLDRTQDTFRLETNGLHFQYPADERQVLDGVDLLIPPGARVGITGPSGSGKTTLLHILTGLYPPSEGTVRLGARSLNEYRLEELRSSITMVGDRYDLFEGTIEDNLRVGRPGLGDEDLAWALDLSGLTTDLRNLPDGLQTIVLSEGKNMSSGKVQRLLIARAILNRPRLLVLDEALRGIDPERRNRLVQGLLAEADCTLIFVSQDWEVLRHLETVYFLDEGRLTESVSPEQIPPSSLTRHFLDGTPRTEA